MSFSIVAEKITQDQSNHLVIGHLSSTIDQFSSILKDCCRLDHLVILPSPADDLHTNRQLHFRIPGIYAKATRHTHGRMTSDIEWTRVADRPNSHSESLQD